MRFIIRWKLVKNGFFYSSVKPLLVVLFLTQIFLFPMSAKSDSFGEWAGSHFINGCGLIVSAAAGGVGLTSIGANLNYLHKIKKQHLAWRIIGYSASGANIFASILWNHIHNKGDDYNSRSKTLVPAHAVIAIFDLGLTVWASRIPGKVEQKLSFQPTLMTDSNHQPIVGMTICLLQF